LQNISGTNAAAWQLKLANDILSLAKQPAKPISVTRGLEKMANFFGKSSPNCCQAKKYLHQYYESSNHSHYTTFDTHKYLQQVCFVTAYIDKNEVKLLK
jgi:hypothetical protein